MGTLTQNYSIRDARSYLYTGLIGLDDLGEFVAKTKDEREVYLAKAFRSIGQVVHLIQDMAAPAHVRDDPHLSVSENAQNVLNADRSHYEARTKDRPIPLAPYPIVKFNNYQPYWSGNGAGLADFTNPNFVSEDTNFNALEQGATDGKHPSPTLDINDFSIVSIQGLDPDARDARGNLLEGNLLFFGNTFTDHYTGGIVRNDRMTTRSIFDGELRKANAKPIFSLNRFNFDEQAKLLLPRAVGYSAGLLDYFFRGRLTSPKNVSFNEDRTAVSFKVFNEKPDEVAGPGNLVVLATYRSYEGAPEESQLSEPVEVTALPQAGQDILATPFRFPNQIPITVKDLKFTVAFRGQLGVESDAVMGYVFTPKPHYVFVIQEGVTLGDTGAGRETICTHPSCESGNYTILYDQEFRDRRWSINSQVLTGRFVAYGEIKRVSLAYFTGSTTLSGEGKLFINEQEIVKGNWEIGDTPEPPAAWRVEVDPELVGVTYLLRVTMGDDSTFILGLASYRFLHKEAYKEWGYFLFHGDQRPLFVLTRSNAQMNVTLGHWLTPDLLVSDFDQWELVQLSGYGEDARFSTSRREPPDYPILLYRESLSLNPTSYLQESTFLCDPCYSVDNSHYAEDLYASLPVPDFLPLPITGRYRRVYSQEELDALSVLEIEPEYYDLIFD